jgi:N-acetylneuraminic acid mutarotase
MVTVGRRTSLTLVWVAACSFTCAKVLAFFHSQVQTTTFHRALTFEERVNYQRAIEEVYWRHRVWPKNASPSKPSLDTVMPRAQLEKKVKTYLGNSQALEHYWKTSVTAGQLQAEMDRMAKQTKQPDMLRELFEALGNDSFAIAECLARPVLAERILTSSYAYDQRIHGPLRLLAEADLAAHAGIEQMKETSGRYSEINLVRSNDSHNEPHDAEHHTNVNNHEWDEIVQKLAATFNRSKGTPTETYGTIPVRQLSPLQENEVGFYVTAVTEKAEGHLKLAMVTWSKKPVEEWRAKAEGPDLAAKEEFNAVYRLPEVSGATTGCSNDSWAVTSLNLPTPRFVHTAVWTGTEMIIWGGGFGDPLTPTNTGGKYNPSTDAWTTMSTVDAPSPRGGHTAVWTGSEMIVWGGGWLNTGGRYNPVTDSWTPIPTTNAPSARSGHSAAWTGSEMIVWGGFDSVEELNTGGLYNPVTNSWRATSTINAASPRLWHSTVWTGSEMIVWGGYVYNNINQYLNSGGRYNPSTNRWTATSTTNAPSTRRNHTAVWTGSQMIVWGGDGPDDFNLNSGARYDPATNSWTAASTTNVPAGRYSHTAVWTGREMIVWGGQTAPGFVNTGSRYNPNTNSWSAISATNAPPRRLLHSAVWTGTEMIVWGGEGDSASGNLNTGGRYNPSTDSWAPNQPPEGRIYHTAVWTGTDMIVWGGLNGFSGLNTGGKYNPATDSWMATSIASAPSPRYYHTAIWTGSEMIVWGGFDGNFNVNSGGRYDPGTNSWTSTSTTNAPRGREVHTAIWSGTEMIVWGGTDDLGSKLNTGGRYNPNTDNWRTTSTTNPPAGRYSHTAVWTGSEMIVWGGTSDGSNSLNTGGRYNPTADSWTVTGVTNAPTSRYFHTAVWTGSEMIVWGGQVNSNILLSTGARYDPSTDAWMRTSITDAPSIRSDQTAVWTGSEMIVWGGFDNNVFWLNTGGKYDPKMDSWASISTSNDAPIGRWGHTTVWTDTEMIVWGGINDGFGYLNNGGRYCGPRPTPTPTGGALGNISTRLNVGTADKVSIAGFIIQGTEPKKVFIRALGPTIAQPPYNLPGTLVNPTLELHDIKATIATNNDWQTTQLGGIISTDQSGEIATTNYAPPNPAESAIIATLAPGNYTAIVRGVNNTTGVALVEVYDLSTRSNSRLTNISTRGFVGTSDNVMIGGVIVITQPTTVLLRALGPTLGQAPFNLAGAIANPQLELHDAINTIARNDDWQTTQVGELIPADQVSQIQATGYAPTNTSESAILVKLQPGNYTAIVRGANNSTGVALVEVYRLQ